MKSIEDIASLLKDYCDIAKSSSWEVVPKVTLCSESKRCCLLGACLMANGIDNPHYISAAADLLKITTAQAGAIATGFDNNPIELYAKRPDLLDWYKLGNGLRSEITKKEI